MVPSAKFPLFQSLYTTPQSLADPAAGVPYSIAASIHVGDPRVGRKVNFAGGEIPSGGKSPRKCIYSVPAQETAKHRAKLGWRPLSDIGAVTMPTR